MTYIAEVMKSYKGLVALVDESFELDPTSKSGRFYILSAVILPASSLALSRRELALINGDRIWHATELNHQRKLDQIHANLGWIEMNVEACDVYVLKTIETVTTSRQEMRNVCVEEFFTTIYQDLGVEVFIFDSSNLREINEQDRRLHRDAMRAGLLSRRSLLFHCWGSEEPLLGLPDTVAWAFRQEVTRAESSWTHGLREFAKVRLL